MKKTYLIVFISAFLLSGCLKFWGSQAPMMSGSNGGQVKTYPPMAR